MEYEAVEEEEALSAWAQTGEENVEGTLRPRKLDEFVGQPRVREQLELVLESARRRGVPPDHVLLSGPPPNNLVSAVSTARSRRSRPSSSTS